MQLMSQNLKLRRNGRGLYDSSAMSRNDVILGNSSGPEEALIKCSSHFVPLERVMGKRLIDKTRGIKMDDSARPPNACSNVESGDGKDLKSPVTDLTSLCSSEENARDRQLYDLTIDIIDKLRHAFWLRSKIENTTHFDTLIKHLERNGAGDLGVTSCFRKAISAARTAQTSEDGQCYYLTAQEVHTTNTNRFITD